jgi:hypothetical protein
MVLRAMLPNQIEDKIMKTIKLLIPLHMNMHYAKLILDNWHQTESLTLTKDTLEVELVDSTGLTEQLDDLWCSMSPEGSVGFVDFIQTFGTVEPNPFGSGDQGEPTLYYLLNDKQKELYGRITMEIDEFDGDLPLSQIKEVYAALIQDPEMIDFS